MKIIHRFPYNTEPFANKPSSRDTAVYDLQGLELLQSQLIIEQILRQYDSDHCDLLGYRNVLRFSPALK